MSPRGKPVRTNRARPINKAGWQALAAASSIAAGTQAYADPIRFENTGNQWDWELDATLHTDNPSSFLDVVLPPDAQGDTYMDHTNLKQAVYYGSLANPTTTALYGYGGIMVAPGDRFALAVDAGTPIGGGGQIFETLSWIQVLYYGSTTTYIPEGVQTYLGARLQINYQTHYGWIGVVRNGWELDTFAWGYETDPGVPVPAGVPEPASLAMLALGFCALRRR